MLLLKFNAANFGFHPLHKWARNQYNRTKMKWFICLGTRHSCINFPKSNNCFTLARWSVRNKNTIWGQKLAWHKTCSLSWMRRTTSTLTTSSLHAPCVYRNKLELIRGGNKSVYMTAMRSRRFGIKCFTACYDSPASRSLRNHQGMPTRGVGSLTL
jgi:hypothetical protein